jgi:hypothetical protein
VRAYKITVARPKTEEIIARELSGEYIPLWRSSLVVTESLDEAVTKTIKYYNDIDGVDDYYLTDISVVASTDDGADGVLLM